MNETEFNRAMRGKETRKRYPSDLAAWARKNEEKRANPFLEEQRAREAARQARVDREIAKRERLEREILQIRWTA
jgi:hypothetical protein